MKNTPRLLIILGVIAGGIIVGFFRVSGEGNQTPKATRQKIFDVASGDTNNEVLKSIVARQKTLQKENEHLMEANRKLREEYTQKTAKAIETSKHSLKEELTKAAARIEHEVNQKIKQLKEARHSNSGKLEFEVKDKSEIIQDQMITSVPDLSKERPIKTEQSELSLEHKDSPTLSNTALEERKESEPYYTIPDGSTIANTVLTSPLIGEIPVNGQLLAPAFPFKAEISYKDTANMFSANGVPLPAGISGMILQGFSVGNMSMGCTRAYVKKVLFVFEDGHYVVYPGPKDSKGDDATSVYPKNTLGYLSDYYNNPCIAGQYLTNAPKVISSLTAFGLGAGVGGAIAKAQTKTLTSAHQSTRIFTGDLGKFAAGYGVGEGSRAALEWYKSRVHDAFDAIFVPSSVNRRPTRLIFNVTQTIKLDLNKTGRKLSYEHANDMSASDTSFD